MSRILGKNTSETFIRFVVGTDDQRPDRLDGLFAASGSLRDGGLLEPYQEDWLDQLYTWFNAELPCPPFSKGQIPAHGVSWFRSSATQFIARMWDVSALLRDYGCPVRLLKTDNPGAIFYADPYQVVASRRWARRKNALTGTSPRGSGGASKNLPDSGPVFRADCNL